MLRNTHTAVICTRSRSESLSNLINSITACDQSDQILVLIVLNGHKKTDFNELKNQVEQSPLKIDVIESSPGLAAARNIALMHLSGEIVTFFDDDILLPKNYFTEVDQAFVSYPEIEGLSPRIRGLYSGESALRKRFTLAKSKYGRVTKNGDNYWVPDTYTKSTTNVDWLPGCSMAYRISAIGGKKFSEELMLGPTGGYSLGEDVDFSIQFKHLIALNVISIDHLQAASVRDDSSLMSEARGRWNVFLARKHPDNVSLFYSAVYCLSSVFYFGIRSLVSRDEFIGLFKQRLIQMRGFIQEVLNPKLVCSKND
jgi:GT2 family glycosyltransferase